MFFVGGRVFAFFLRFVGGRVGGAGGAAVVGCSETRNGGGKGRGLESREGEIAETDDASGEFVEHYVVFFC